MNRKAPYEIFVKVLPKLEIGKTKTSEKKLLKPIPRQEAA